MYGDKITVSQDKDAMDRYILPMAFLVDDKLLTLDLHGWLLATGCHNMVSCLTNHH